MLFNRQRADGEAHPGDAASHHHRLGRARFLRQFKVRSGRGARVQGHGVPAVLRLVHSALLARARRESCHSRLRLQLPHRRLPAGSATRI